ncbi:MAG: tetratricopeptide repeat protein [Thermoguttaceae bacterium]
MKNMYRIVGCLFLCACLLLVAGCQQKIADKDNPLFQNQESAADQQRHTAEAFTNMVLLFNTLENTPLLLGLPGASVEIQTVSRLNKWIEFQERNKFWKNDPYFAELSGAFAEMSQKLQQVLDSLRNLRGDEEKITQTVDVSQLIAELKGLPEQFQELTKKTGIDFSEEFSVVQNLADRFSRVRNLQEAAVLASADQIKAETDQLLLLQRNLSSFSELFKIDAFVFHNADADHFKQSIWMRNIANWVNRDQQAPLDRAIALFDWTVRNVDLRLGHVTLPTGQQILTPVQEPWQTLLLGHGTVADRAWVFIELLRQQRIDAALLCLPNEENPDSPIPWAVGVLIDNNIYLFLPDFGLAIPGPKGVALRQQADSTKTSELEYVDVATLAQVVENEALLRQLDTEGVRFPIDSDKLKESIVLIAETPSSASERMSLVQKELSGEEAVLLYQPFQDLSDRFSQQPYVKDVQHWNHPFSALYERQTHPERVDGMMLPFRFVDPTTNRTSLWSGRVLYFLGKHAGPESAITHYQEAKMPDRKYQELVQSQTIAMTPEMQATFALAKLNAHYWLGLTCLETGRPALAQEYFEDVARSPLLGTGQFWTYALAYNLGRALEEQGEYERAVQQYERYARAPGARGNALRSKWLTREGHLKETTAQNTAVAEPVVEPTSESTTQPAVPLTAGPVQQPAVEENVIKEPVEEMPLIEEKVETEPVVEEVILVEPQLLEEPPN